MADSSEDTKYCTNCKKDISTANFMMHEVHCRRHIVLCDHCKEPVPRSEMDEHFNDLHAKVSCSLCGQDVEKPKLEEHMSKLCSKKPAGCPYCELELPQVDLIAHQNYCGTRTEACPKCGQFVMMKDQLQHEVSNCEYPTPKPSTNGQAADRNRDLDFSAIGYEFDDSGFNPFAMHELSRMMDETRMPETLNSRADIPGFGKRRNQPSTQSRSYTNNNTTRSRKSTTNRKSELNRQRQQVTEPEPPDNLDEEADLLLAMRLQHEDDQELDSMIRQIEKQSPVQPPVSPETDSPANVNTYPDDDELIPCEFCGEPFPVDILVQHQSGCDPLSTGQWNDDTSWRGERNNEVQGGSRGRGVSIPVINNLDSDWSNAREIPIRKEWESPTVSPPPDELVDEEGEIILPCEFCDEVFPFELLIQHQSVCDFNPSMTPRTQTPAASSHQKPATRNSNILSSAAQEVLQVSSRSHRHQGQPTWVGDEDDSDDEIIDHLQDVREYTESSNPERTRYAARNDNYHGSSSRSVTTKYGAPLNEFDDYLTRGTRSRTRDHTSSRLADTNRGSGTSGTSRRSSDGRTQRVLDELLSVGAPEHDLLGSVGNSKKKSAKNEDNLVKRGQPSTGTRKKTTTTTASSRDVMRELHRTSNSTQAPKPKKRVNGGVDDFTTPPFNIQPVGRAPRQRPSHGISTEPRDRFGQAHSRQKPPSHRRFEDDDDNI